MSRHSSLQEVGRTALSALLLMGAMSCGDDRSSPTGPRVGIPSPGGARGAISAVVVNGIEIRALFPGLSGEAMRISESGQIGGISYPGHHARYWASAATDNVDIETLGGTYGTGMGVNDAGAVVGYSWPADEGDRAFIWTQSTGTVRLPNLGDRTRAYAINSSGVVVGQADMPGSTQHAWIWHPDAPNGTAGTLTDLGPAWGPQRSEATDISDAGVVVGWRDADTFTPRAVKWSPTTGIVQLATIAGTGLGYARAINTNGDVAGYSTAADGLLHATLWKNGESAVTDLNAAGGCSEQSYGYGINDMGWVAGQCGTHAVVWTPTDMIVLPANPDWGSPGGEARDINNAGEVVGTMAGTSVYWKLPMSSPNPGLISASTNSGPFNAGASHTCALRSNGSALCWGYAPYGQSGIPSTERLTEISASFATTCGVRTNQTIGCWGTDGSGHLNVPAGTFSQVSAGNYGACGLRTDQTVICWGGQEQLPAGTYTEVSAGSGTTCGLRANGTVVCKNYNGSLGSGPLTTHLGAFLQVSVGDSFACAITASGTLECWGSNAYGQIDDMPRGTFTQVSMAAAAACALATDSELYCWGYDGPGGGGVIHPPPGPFERLTMGNYHGCAQRTNGGIICWGANGAGETNVPAEFADNTPPTVSAGGPYATSEGSPAIFNFSASDVDRDALTYTWNFGDGVTGTGAVLPASHIYADNGSVNPGTYSVTISVTDGKSSPVTAMSVVTVTNAAPIVALRVLRPSTSVASVGETFTFTYTMTDPGAVDGPWRGVVDWKDGTSSQIQVTSTSETNGECPPACTLHTYSTAGTYDIALSFTDKDGGVGTGTAQVVVHRPPVASAGGPYSGAEGSPIAFHGTASDPDGDAIVSYVWDFGDGASSSGPDVSHAYGDNGTYLVSLIVTDARGAQSGPATTATVTNVAPRATLNVPASVNEGSSFAVSLTNPIDAAGDRASLTYAFDCGDGGGLSGFSSSISRSCPTTDNGSRTVRAQVRDKDQGSTAYGGALSVLNVAPSVSIIGGPATVTAKSNFNIQFRFSDPGVADRPWYYQIAWGDGGKNTGPLAATAQGATITQTYAYKKAGTYTITIRVADKEVGIGAATVQVNVR